jgi:hypothetical protein
VEVTRVSHDTIAKVKVIKAKASEAVKVELRRGERVSASEAQLVTVFQVPLSLVVVEKKVPLS